MIRVGVIGMGFIGQVHVEALRRLGYVEVAAVADLSQQAADTKAALLSVARAYGDYRRMLYEADVQAVHICTPNQYHYPMAKDAILAGKHVLCDKPLAMSAKEAEELVALGKQKDVVLATNFNIRFYPLVRQIKAMIDDGALGDIFAVTGSYQQDWLLKETDYNWRIEPEMTGASRAVNDIGSHWLDCAEYMTGTKINKVYADFAIFHPTRKKPVRQEDTFTAGASDSGLTQDVPVKTEDFAAVLLRFDSGAHGCLFVSQVSAGRKNRIIFEIHGSKASVCLDTERPNELWIGKRESGNEILLKDPSLVNPYAGQAISYPGGHNEGFADAFKHCFSAFYGHIRDKRKTPADFATFADGYRDICLCEKIVQSAKSGVWVMV